MKIYLLRHGQTSYNVEKRYQGTLDIPLSEEGRAQLVRADISPKKVYVSPLIRARSTADVLFPEAEQVVIDDFREMCFGIFQGRNYIEMEHDPEYIESGKRNSATVPVTPLYRWWRKPWKTGRKCW